ncbi:MAG: response regulator [Ktedonobacterales bacterium]
MPATEPILAVDDSAPIRDMIVSMLAPRGYRVATAANGREALQRLRAAVGPYVVLLDIVMPLLDGLGLCQEIERDERLRTAGHHIILMSSTIRLSAPDIPVTSGQLIKPFTRQQLLAAVEAVRRETL